MLNTDNAFTAKHWKNNSRNDLQIHSHPSKLSHTCAPAQTAQWRCVYVMMNECGHPTKNKLIRRGSERRSNGGGIVREAHSLITRRTPSSICLHSVITLWNTTSTIHSCTHTQICSGGAWKISSLFPTKNPRIFGYGLLWTCTRRVLDTPPLTRGVLDTPPRTMT